MFRRRIYAQGFTVLAMFVGSVYWSKDREKRKELEGIMSETKKKEKHEKWLRELEARDDEEREMRAQLLADKAAQAEATRVAEEAVLQSAQKPGVLQSVKELVSGKR